MGVGTVSGFIWWFLYAANGPHITWTQLTDFHACDTNGANFVELKANGYTCDIFHDPRPSTMSLSILVMIEMFNALNALSENQSLLSVTPLSNMYVLVACALSFLLHLAIVYVPFLASIFHVAPLNTEEWLHVLYLSLPIFLLDETLKAISRYTSGNVHTALSPAAARPHCTASHELLTDGLSLFSPVVVLSVGCCCRLRRVVCGVAVWRAVCVSLGWLLGWLLVAGWWRCVCSVPAQSAAEMQERRRQINHELAHVAIINTHNPNLTALASSPFDQAQDIPTQHTEEADTLLLPSSHTATFPLLSSPSLSSASSPSNVSPPPSRSTSPLPVQYRFLSSIVPYSISSLPWYQRLMRRSLSNQERLRAQRAHSAGQSSLSSAASGAHSSSPQFGALSGHSRDRDSQTSDASSDDDPALVQLLKKV